MRITRLQVKDVRQHRDRDLTLAPGLTVVRGPNEAGKSTIQRILEIALTRKVTSSNGDIDALRPWTAAEDARPWIRLEFESEDEDGVRKGSLEKSFRGSKGTVRLEVDGEVITDPAEADLRVAELTGIPTEPFFRSTASVRHHEVDDLARDESALRDRLQASISGGDRGTSAAKKKLDRAIKDLSRGGEKNPGRLKTAEEAVSRTRLSVEQGEAALGQLETDRDALAVARDQRAGAEADLAERRAMLERARQAERLISEREAAQGRFERYRTAVGVSEQLASLSAAHPSPSPLPVLRQIVERLRALDATIRELKAKLEGEVSVDYQVTTPEPTWRGPAILGFVLIGIGVAAAVASEVVLKNQPALLPVGIAGVVIGALIAFFAWRQRSLALDFRAQRELKGVEIDRRLRGRSQLEQELKVAQADTDAQLEMISLPNVAAADDLLARETEHVQQIDRLTSQLDGLVGKEPSEALPGLRDAAALEVEQKTHALEALGPIAKEPRARERLEVEVRDQEGALERARDDEANARAKVEANPVDAEQVNGEAERLVAWSEQLAAIQRRSRVYERTLAAIEQAEQATMRTATRFLEKRMVGDLVKISAGRYRRVKVDDRTLDITVFSPEKGDWVDVHELSQGTLDQIFLAARLGLVRLVTGDRRPPLIFDDPFVTFDDARAARAVEVLRELATDFQIIYLTTSDRYDASAEAVVELPGPTAVDDFSQGADRVADAPPAG